MVDGVPPQKYFPFIRFILIKLFKAKYRALPIRKQRLIDGLSISSWGSKTTPYNLIKMKNETDNVKLVGIKSSEMRTKIREKLLRNHGDFLKLQNEERVQSMVTDLAEAFIAGQESYKPSQLANARYLETIPSDSGRQFGLFANLKMHGQLAAPVPQVSDPKTKAPDRGDTTLAGTAEHTVKTPQVPNP